MVLSDPRTREPGRRRRSIFGRSGPILDGGIRYAVQFSSVSSTRVAPGALAWAANKRSFWPIERPSRSRSLRIMPLGARAKKIEHLWHHMKCAVRQGYQRIPCIAGEKSFCRLPVVLRRHCQGKRPHCGQHRVELIRGPPVSAANRALSELGRDGDADGYASGFQSGGAPGNFSAGPANRLGQDVRIRHVPRFRHTRRRSSGFAGGSAMSGKSSSRETSRDRTSARGGSPRTGSRMRT